MEKLLLLVQWMVVLFIASSAGDFYMVVEYDTNGTARPTSLAVSISTVELYVTVLGCDHGYYSVVVDETTTTTTTTTAAGRIAGLRAILVHGKLELQRCVLCACRAYVRLR